MDTVTAYYDYLCPFAQRGMELAEQVAEPLNLAFDWRHFSLVQGNYKGEDGWQLWQDELPTDDPDGGKGLLPFLASHAVRDLGDAGAFRLELARAYHLENQPYTLQTVLNVAEKVGADVGALQEKLADPDLRRALAAEHAEAAANHVHGHADFSLRHGRPGLLPHGGPARHSGRGGQPLRDLPHPADRVPVRAKRETLLRGAPSGLSVTEAYTLQVSATRRAFEHRGVPGGCRGLYRGLCRPCLFAGVEPGQRSRSGERLAQRR